MGALDLALDKMAAQMRRAADRRRVHHGRHTPVSVGEALATTPSNQVPAEEDVVREDEVGREQARSLAGLKPGSYVCPTARFIIA